MPGQAEGAGSLVSDGSHPPWFHHSALKMQGLALDLNTASLVIESDLARVAIERTVFQSHAWTVHWTLAHGEDVTIGKRSLSTELLAIAFGVGPRTGTQSAPYKQEEANVALEGKFVRSGCYLNIPCPGTGRDGDPNVSVYISEEVRNAVATLVGSDG